MALNFHFALRHKLDCAYEFFFGFFLDGLSFGILLGGYE